MHIKQHKCEANNNNIEKQTINTTNINKNTNKRTKKTNKHETSKKHTRQNIQNKQTKT